MQIDPTDSVCRWPACICRATGVYCSTKDKKTPKTKRSIAPRSLKGELRAKEKKVLITSDMVFYLKIWDARVHECFECGISLGNTPYMQYLHHMLEKGLSRYAHLRHEDSNIVLLCWGCHEQVHSNLDKMPRLKSYRTELLHLFNLD